MVNFWPKSKAIGLVFCQNLIQNRFGPFYVKNFWDTKMGYTKILVNFWSKSKAIGLVFCQNLIQNRFGPKFDPKYFEKFGTQNGQFLAKK